MASFEQIIFLLQFLTLLGSFFFIVYSLMIAFKKEEPDTDINMVHQIINFCIIVIAFGIGLFSFFSDPEQVLIIALIKFETLFFIFGIMLFTILIFIYLAKRTMKINESYKSKKWQS